MRFMERFSSIEHGTVHNILQHAECAQHPFIIVHNGSKRSNSPR